MTTTNENATERAERFASIYATKIIAAMAKEPGAWMDTPATAPALAVKMTAALARGTAHVSPQAKAAAKALGVAPTRAGIMAFLAGD